MTSGKKSWSCVLAALLFTAAAQALVPESGGNPYTGITDRNVFSLKPPTPIELPKVEKPPISKITLNGITTIFQNKKALLSAQVPARPPEPAKQEFYTLAEGERDRDIEVISIDEKAGVVKVKNGDNVETLDFANNGAKLTSAPPPSMAPPGGIPQPGMPGVHGIPAPPIGGPGLRNPRSPHYSNPNNNPGSNADGSASGVNSGSANYGVNPSATPIQIPQMTSEEQTIMIEVERERTKDLIQRGEVPPPPLTDLTPEGAAGTILPQ